MTACPFCGEAVRPAAGIGLAASFMWQHVRTDDAGLGPCRYQNIATPKGAA